MQCFLAHVAWNCPDSYEGHSARLLPPKSVVHPQFLHAVFMTQSLHFSVTDCFGSCAVLLQHVFCADVMSA